MVICNRIFQVIEIFIIDKMFCNYSIFSQPSLYYGLKYGKNGFSVQVFKALARMDRENGSLCPFLEGIGICYPLNAQNIFSGAEL